MPDIPPEVIGLVVDQVDTKSLKACSLAAVAFRHPAQKRLHENLSISPERYHLGTRAIVDADKHFVQHPHLARYVTMFELIVVPGPHNDVDIVALEAILHRITAATHLALSFSAYFDDSPDTSASDWNTIPRKLTDCFLHWMVSRRPFTRRLDLASVWQLSVDVFVPVLSAAPKVDIREVTLSGDSSSDPAVGQQISLRDLSVKTSPSVAKLLLRPEFTPYIESLRTFTFRFTDSSTEMIDLFSHVARYIECVKLLALTEARPFPSTANGHWEEILEQEALAVPKTLPLIRAASVQLRGPDLFVGRSENFTGGGGEQVRRLCDALIARLLAHLLTPSVSPQLRTLEFELSLTIDSGDDLPELRPTILAALDDLIASHPNIRDVCWATDVFFYPSWRPGPGPAALLDQLQRAATRALPKAVEKGAQIRVRRIDITSW
ncbi:hypothetical protein MKEN_00730600 [Mycena kentingensis (nom. inval.)]|nr:hypothetical protein MKEN_00730600 [Mycena kentingensis (nom. inval.)]